MFLRNIRVTNFRNISSVVLGGIGKRLEIWGDNGQGKTNLLEAILVLLSGKSFRGRSEVESIKDGADQTIVSGLVEMSSGVQHQVEVCIYAEEGKVIRVDDKKVSVANLSKLLGVVLFTPEEVDLIRTSSAKRRRVLDEIMMSVSGDYRKLMADFIRIWRHRNQLLLAIKQSRATEQDLRVWDEQMAAVGFKIMSLRKEFIVGWSGEVAAKHVAFGLAKGSQAGCRYKPNIGVTTEAEYLRELESSHHVDVVRTHTTKGIHRDDIEFILDGQDAATRASRGELRSIVLSVKLVEVDMLKNRLGDTPVLLLDDVWSELDEARREALNEEVGSAQVFLTTHEQQSGGLEISQGEVGNRVDV